MLNLPFNEGQGSTVHDSSGFGNHGTIYGATWTKGSYGYGLYFDGTDDYVEVPDDDSLDITDAITVMAWIYPLGWGGGNFGRIIEKHFTESYKFYLYNPNGEKAIKFNSYDAGVEARSDNNTIELNSWQHVVVTYNRQNIIFYVNGANKGGGPGTAALGISTQDLIIGNNIDSTRGFNGTIPEVLIYNRAWTADEILSYYNATKGRFGL